MSEFAPLGDQAQVTDNQVLETGAYDALGHPVQQVLSLCMNCYKNGTTRLLLTKIPYFREIILMSFECPHCGFKNSEIQSAAQIAERGARYTLIVEHQADYARQVVKSEYATVRFHQLDIEIPPKRGQLTNVEGLLLEIASDLESDQHERKLVLPDMFAKIDSVISRIRSFLAADPDTLPLTVTVDDPSGNSWIEYLPGEPAHKWSLMEYDRTVDQNVALSLISADDAAQHQEKQRLAKQLATNNNVSALLRQETSGNPTFLSDASEIENLHNEVQTFAATCLGCYKPCNTNMKTINIPHFKEVIIMATNCDHCGYKSNEVKTGGAIPDKGRKITLKVSDPTDLARDILKSETCSLLAPELGLDLTAGTLGGRFTTVEGLLVQVMLELESRVFSQSSDSMDADTKAKWTDFFAKLQRAVDGEVSFTLTMEDPMAASYIQNVYAPDPDPNMLIEDYERTFDQNEDLGLNDMMTDQVAVQE